MTNNNTNKTKMKSQRKNKAWLRNPAQRKNSKIFTAKFIQRKDGSFHMIGNETKFLSRKNAVSSEWVNVDTRDFATELRRCGVSSF